MAKKKPAQRKPAAKDLEGKARTVQSRLKASGKTTRAKGHLSATTRRNQAKRDAK